MEIVFEQDNMEATAKEFLQIGKEYKVFAFSGDLGAGKTTFINALCIELGVEEAVTSPTYSIIQQYTAGDKIIYHIDLYRIKNKEEATEAGIEDCLYSNEICMVEWPERAPSISPKKLFFHLLKFFQEIKGN